MATQIKQITSALTLGEGPHWDESTQALYFVDIYGSTVHRYLPEKDEHTFAKVENEELGKRVVSLIIPIKDKPNNFLISFGADLAVITWDGVSPSVSSLEILVSTNSSPDVRINDGKTSPDGILFAGTMAYEAKLPILPEAGAFYAFPKKKPKVLFDSVSLSNGLAWSSDMKLFFYIDSYKYTVDVFDYDAKEVQISNRRTLFDFKKHNIPGIPDGMTIDTEDNLWVANFGGSQVLKINSKTGALLTSIKFPCPNVTSVAFGGPTLEDLYVTSANMTLNDDVELTPEAGYTFKVTGTGSKGIAGVPAEL